MPSLRQQVYKATAWRFSVDIGQQVLQIIFTAILARLLTRADFGLVAMALLFNRFVFSVTQLGLGTAIIQSQEVTDAQISAIFIIHLGINFIISLVCFFGAPLAATFFNQPGLDHIVKVLAWVIFINSVGFPRILMFKQLQMGSTSLLELGSMIMGNIVGIVMAFTGFGAWALVYRQISVSLTFSIMIWFIARWSPCKPQFSGIRGLLQFGLNMLGSRIFYYFSQNMASIIIGKFIGVEILASFNIAYNLAIVPASKVQSIFTNVLGPAFAKIHTDINDFRNKFYSTLFSLSFVFIPAMFGLSAVSVNLVRVIYGEKWRDAGYFLSFLAIVGLAKGMEHLMRVTIFSSGRASFIFKITVAETAVSIPLLFAGSYYFGVYGLIGGYLLASMFAFLLSIYGAQRALEDFSIFWRATLRTIIVASCMFLFVAVISKIIPVQLWAVLCLQIALGVIFYTVLRILFLSKHEKAVVIIWPFINLVLGKLNRL